MSEWANGPGFDVVQGPDSGRGRTFRVVTATATVLFGLSALTVLVAQRDTDGANRTDVSSLPAAELIRKAPEITMAEGSARVSVEERLTRSFESGGSGSTPPRREGAVDFHGERGWLKAGEASGEGDTAFRGPETRYLGNVIYEGMPFLTPISGSNSRSVTGSGGAAVSGSSPPLQAVPAPSVVTTIPPVEATPPQPPATPVVPTAPPPVAGGTGGVEIRDRVAAIGGGSWQPVKPWTRYDIEALEASGLPGLASMGASVANRFPARSMRVLEGIGDDVRSLGTEQVRGVETTHFAGSVDPGKVTGSVTMWPGESSRASGLGGAAMRVDVWLDAEGRVRRLATSLQTPSAREDTSEGTLQFVSTVELYDFGVEVVVEAPPQDEVSDFLDQMRDRPLLPPPPPTPLAPPPPVTTVPE